MALDYRLGRNTWGHALHAGTMRQVQLNKWADKLRDRFQGAYRVSVMIHSPRYPKVGEPLLWTAAAGHDVLASVYAVEPCCGTNDMYTVFARVTQKDKTT